MISPAPAVATRAARLTLCVSGGRLALVVCPACLGPFAPLAFAGDPGGDLGAALRSGRVSVARCGRCGATFSRLAPASDGALDCEMSRGT